jgi:hypothetical protein
VLMGGRREGERPSRLGMVGSGIAVVTWRGWLNSECLGCNGCEIYVGGLVQVLSWLLEIETDDKTQSEACDDQIQR